MTQTDRDTSGYPFLYGAEYYRAPTPTPEFWRDDLQRMADSGFNAVKFFVQWRWVHRRPETFFTDDIDRLMDLAADNGLAVTINLIFDVAPAWIFASYPDCPMVTAAGTVLEPRAVPCRAIGGYPGPCFNHPLAQAAREAFLRHVVSRYAEHAAMGMWDVWNEPESCLFLRHPPREENLLCYCAHCRSAFQAWLETRHHRIEHLNDVWGRCYEDWEEIELPRVRGTYADMVEWRQFHLDVLAGEARRRIAAVKAIDAEHPVYLHPVPNTMAPFNAVTGVDDFQVADGCDCFGGTTAKAPVTPLQTVSAAQGRVAYNVEVHLRAGDTSMYPREMTLRDIADSFVPQIGLGIRGFLYWQYRCESLGAEAPAWGLLDPDGSAGTTHQAAVEFWRRLRPVAGRIMQAAVEPPEVAILKSTPNEIFHWCMVGNLDGLRRGIDGYTNLFYEQNCRVAYVNDRIVVEGLPACVRLLVIPECYAMAQEVADAVAAWVHGGGTLLCEAHTGGYNLTVGRHSRVLPGLGLATAFGLRESRVTAVAHLAESQSQDSAGEVLSDVAKALEAYGWRGGEMLPLRTGDGGTLLGASRYAELDGEGLEALASLPDRPPCVAVRCVGRGAVVYIGTLAGRGWTPDANPALSFLLARTLEIAGVTPATDHRRDWPDNVRWDALRTGDGDALALWNRRTDSVTLSIPRAEPMRGLFTGQTADGDITLAAGQADLFVPARWPKGVSPIFSSF